MKRIALLVALVLVIAACGDDDATDTTTTQAATATTAAEVTDTTESMTEDEMAEDETTEDETTEEDMTESMSPEGTIFEITSVTFGAPMVVITNVGTETGSLGGHWICQRPSYQELPAIDVGPGESVAISLGGSVFLPPPGTLTIEAQLNIGSITPSSGEIGLYSSNSFGSAEAIVSYVEWGNSGHGRSSTAVEAGAWDEGGFVATTNESAGIQQDTIFSMASSGWSGF